MIHNNLNVQRVIILLVRIYYIDGNKDYIELA